MPVCLCVVAALVAPHCALAQFGNGGITVVTQPTPPPSLLVSIMPTVAGVQNLQLKTGPGVLSQYAICANESEPLYARFYDSSTPYSPGSMMTPIWRMTILPGPCPQQSGLFALPFANGLAVTITSVNSDTDQTAVVPGEFYLDVGFR